MTIKYYHDVVQGTDEWAQLRCGLLTASEMKLAISKKTDRKTGEVTYKSPDDDKAVAHLYELAAQRVTQYVEPTFLGEHMMRGNADEIDARIAYDKTYAPVETCGFITNDKWGFKIGYSPDGLIGDDGQIEAKSRKQKFQIETITNDEMDPDFLIQVQTGLLVSERSWCDFISYCGGMPMYTTRVFPDDVLHKAIENAAGAFHEKLFGLIEKYQGMLDNPAARLLPTERKIYEEIF